MLNEEGGIDPLEFRFHAMTDRVATTGTTWLGLASSLGKFRLSATSDASAQASDRDPEIDRLLALPTGDYQASQRAALKRAFLWQAPEVAEHAKQIIDLLARPSDTLTLVMRERPTDHPRPTYLHHRGEYTQPTEAVAPRLPAMLLPPGKPAPKDRLEFARWLVSPELVVWGGEFGRTPMVESNPALGRSAGRDHHPQAFTMWMAGGGIRPGITYGATDDFGFHIVENPLHVHDIQATILHTLGFDHERLTYHHAGRDFRLTDVHGKVVYDLLA